MLDTATLNRSAARVSALRDALRLGAHDPTKVGANEGLAEELATRSVTLVRDDAAAIPLKVEPDTRILVLEPTPTNVTPADTMALYEATLADELRARHSKTTGIVYANDPSSEEISALVGTGASHDVVVVGTVNATEGQVELVRALARTTRVLITMSMREPQDLSSFPEVATHIATYSGHRSSMRAATAAMLGDGTFGGRLPVAIPGLYPSGHGL